MGREAGSTVHVGPIVTSSVFYDPDVDERPRWKRLGHLGIEMEAGMLYTVGAVHRVEALAMMTVSDILGATEDDRERISDAHLRQGVDDMMRIACHVADPADRGASLPIRWVSHRSAPVGERAGGEVERRPVGPARGSEPPSDGRRGRGV